MALLTLTADLTALLPTWPVLYIIHAMVTAIALRSEPGIVQYTMHIVLCLCYHNSSPYTPHTGGFRFAVNHPVASCVMNMIVASSGSLLMNLMLGRPLVQGVVSEEKALVSVLAWCVCVCICVCVCVRAYAHTRTCVAVWWPRTTILNVLNDIHLVSINITHISHASHNFVSQLSGFLFIFHLVTWSTAYVQQHM